MGNHLNSPPADRPMTRHSPAPDANTVLVVDDDEDSRIIYGTILKERGIRVLHARDGDECVRMARSERPHLVLMDLSMPVLDGWRAAERLRGDPNTACIPIIAITAHAFETERERALRAGCDQVLVKPVMPGLLIAEVNRWLLQYREALAKAAPPARAGPGRGDSSLAAIPSTRVGESGANPADPAAS